MNLKSAQSLLKTYRPGKPELQDPQAQKAVRIVEGVPEQKAALDAQIEFDDRQVVTIATIVPGEEFLGRIDGTLENLQKGFQWSSLKQPPFLAGAVAVLVLLGVLVYFWLDWMQNFPGKDSAERMVDATEEMTGVELEPKVTEAGLLEDWFFSNGYENFRMLPEFAHLKTAGCRVFRQDGCPVAQVAVEKHNMLLYIFHSDDFGVKIEPPEHWRYFQQGEWAAAIRGEGDTCFMVAFRGKTGEMKDFIANLGK
jgi:hypothetical protein